MNRIVLDIRIELLSDAIFSSGNSIPGGEDITLRLDSAGNAFLPGSTVKGLLRETLENYLCWSKSGTQEDLDDLLGKQSFQAAESPRRLLFSNLYPQVQPERIGQRTFTAMENGIVKGGSLRMALCLRSGTVLTGTIVCAEDDVELVQKGVRLMQWIGLMRNRGFGHVKSTATSAGQLQQSAALEEGHWIHYRLKLRTPLAISAGTADPNDADRKNYTDGLNFIPGSAVRGMVMSALSQNAPEWFAAHKQELLQRVKFRNAQPVLENRQMLPMPMGFYEDRGQTEFYSVLLQDVTAGHKRARLGRYFSMGENGVIHHGTPVMEQSLRISIASNSQDRQMFTVEAMAADTVLEGYIHLADPTLAPKVAEAFGKQVWLGADRYAGSGLCDVELLDNQAPEYAGFSYRPGDEIPETLYMMIVSPTAMMRNAEVCGLTNEILSELLGVEAEIERCAVSLQKHSGINRTWGCASHIVSMYAPGSIFRIRCLKQAPALERLKALERDGIGIRRAEGCGQLIFLRAYADICDYERRKQKDVSWAEEHRQRQARCKWLLNTKFPEGTSDSWRGTLQQECESILHGKKSIDALYRFLEHHSEERGQEYTENIMPIRQKFVEIMSTPLEQTLDCPGHPDDMKKRLELLRSWLTLQRKERIV